jgi:iron(III) transport system substrate-binding protein
MLKLTTSSRKKTLGRSIATVIGGLAIAGLVVSCSAETPEPTETAGSGWDAVVEAAQAEGGAVALVTDPPAWQDVQTALYNETTGLSFSVAQSGAGADLETRLLAEIESGNIQTDILNDTDLGFYTNHKDDFVDLSTLGMPNYESYPEEAKWQDLCVIYKRSVSGITYNTDLVDEADVPDTWEDLLDPMWKGKIILSNPAPGGYYLQWALQMQDNFGDDFLTGLADQEPSLNNSSVAAAEQVASGAQLISVLSQGDSASGLIANGAPLAFKIIREPDMGANVCFGIPKDAPHPNSAAVLLNFLLSAESQSAPCMEGLVNVSPAGGEGCFELPDGFTYPELDPATGRYAGIGDEERKAEVLALLGIS